MLTPRAQRALHRIWFNLEAFTLAYEAQAARFAAVRGQGTSGLFKPAEAKRLAEVNQMLAEGKNPYYDPSNDRLKGSGGPSPDHNSVKDRPKVEAEARSLYPGVSKGKPYGRRRTSLTAATIFDGEIELVEGPSLPADHLWCNFCNTSFPKHQITSGIILRKGRSEGDARKFAYIEFTSPKPNVDYHDVVGHSGVEIKMQACPDHVNRLYKLTLPAPD